MLSSVADMEVSCMNRIVALDETLESNTKDQEQKSQQQTEHSRDKVIGDIPC